MSLDRQAIFNAIAARLSSALGFEVSAPLFGFAIPPAEDQPRGYVLPYEEQPEQDVGYPPVHHVMPEVRLYLRHEAEGQDPRCAINTLIGQVDDALRATDLERAAPAGENLYATTLGGLVLFCWREHTVVEPGSLNRQAVVAMVLHVMAPEP